MDQNPKPRLHPLVATAAVAVTAFSLVGIAAITGHLPASKADAAAPLVAAGNGAPAAPAAALAQAAVPPAPTSAEPPAPEHAKPVVKHVAKPAAKPVVAKSAPESQAATPPAPVPAVAQAETVPVAPAAAPSAPPPCLNCGTVDNVREVKQEGKGSGIGAVAGGLLGGILGHQVGQGSGNKLATVLGAVGGAYAGHQVEKSRNESLRYEIAVKMDDGTHRTLTQESVPAWRIGERVRVENGTVQPLAREAGMPPAPAAN